MRVGYNLRKYKFNRNNSFCKRDITILIDIPVYLIDLQHHLDDYIHDCYEIKKIAEELLSVSNKLGCSKKCIEIQLIDVDKFFSTHKKISFGLLKKILSEKMFSSCFLISHLNDSSKYLLEHRKKLLKFTVDRDEEIEFLKFFVDCVANNLEFFSKFSKNTLLELYLFYLNGSKIS